MNPPLFPNNFLSTTPLKSLACPVSQSSCWCPLPSWVIGYGMPRAILWAPNKWNKNRSLKQDTIRLSLESVSADTQSKRIRISRMRLQSGLLKMSLQVYPMQWPSLTSNLCLICQMCLMDEKEVSFWFFWLYFVSSWCPGWGRHVWNLCREAGKVDHRRLTVKQAGVKATAEIKDQEVPRWSKQNGIWTKRALGGGAVWGAHCSPLLISKAPPLLQPLCSSLQKQLRILPLWSYDLDPQNVKEVTLWQLQVQAQEDCVLLYSSLELCQPYVNKSG